MDILPILRYSSLLLTIDEKFSIKFLLEIKIEVPLVTPSGLSVVSLVTNTGILNDGASSCIPPESEITRYDSDNSFKNDP